MVSTNKKISLITTVLLTIAGVDMIAQGLRMIIQYFFDPGSYYVPNLFDIFYDWLLLAIFGFVLSTYGIFHFYHLTKSKGIIKDGMAS